MASEEGRLHVKNRISKLLTNGAWIMEHGTVRHKFARLGKYLLQSCQADEPGRPFMHRAVLEVISLQWFSHADAEGVLDVQSFKPMPNEVLALVSTAVSRSMFRVSRNYITTWFQLYCALQEYASGSRTTQKFEEFPYKNRQQEQRKNIRELWSTRPRMMKKIVNAISVISM